MNHPHKLSVTLELAGIMHADSRGPDGRGSRNVELFEVRLNIHDDGKVASHAVLAVGPRKEAVEMALLRCRNMLRGLENMLASSKTLSAG